MLQDNMFKLGKSLVSQNIVNFEVLEKAMKIKQTEELANRRNLAQILVNDFKADPDQVYREVAKLYGFDSVNLDDELFEDTRIKLIRKMVDRLPDSIKKSLHKQEVIPFDYQTTPPKLILAAVDPTNPLVISIARSLGARRHEVRHISRLQFKNFYEMILSPANAFLQNIELPDMDLLEDDSTPRDEEAIESEINKSFLVNLVEGMLLEAVRRKASDIHIIPRDINNTEILFRVDGRLQTWFAEKGIRPEALSAVVKDRSRNVDRFEREMAQDGFIQRNVDGHKIRYRVSVMPIVGSDVLNKLESIVIRVLDDRNVITDFRELGLQKQAHGDFMKAIRKPQGMVILTGPTGSGKSTTLLASLNHIVKPEINVLTVEDPVEYLIPGVRQIKIGPKNNFEQALRSILRHDPDVVMVGEIRDKETAEIAIKLANTGHLTFSTLHTNDAPSAISRMYKMGLETFLLAYAINIIVAQRLIRKLCERCKRPMSNLDPVIPLSLGFTNAEVAATTFYEAVGCQACQHGYKGRIAIHEAMYISQEIRSIIFSAGKDIDEEAIRKQAIKNGMLTLRASARERVKTGVTTLEEMARSTAEDN